LFSKAKPDSNWKKVAVGLNFENTNNFNNSVFGRYKCYQVFFGNYFLAMLIQETMDTCTSRICKYAIRESISSCIRFLGTNLPNNQIPATQWIWRNEAMLGYQGFV
jgi:hypothetical protein